MTLCLERALFLVAPQDSGKSTQLRSIFVDRRFGTDGNIPTNRKLPYTHHLSNERKLYLRLTSPHESGETPKAFLNKAKAQMRSGRWCFACPLQPDADNKMPDVVETVRRFRNAFEPERIRILFLSPTRHQVELGDFVRGRDLLEELDDVEVACIDGRRRVGNGLLLADFFDFT